MLKKFSAQEIRERHLKSQAWKQMPDETKKELRESWLHLDSQCHKLGGSTHLLPSIIDKNSVIQGCDFSYNPKAYVSMINEIEKQAKHGAVLYAVKNMAEELDLMLESYETDNDYHHVEMTMGFERYQDEQSEIIFSQKRKMREDDIIYPSSIDETRNKIIHLVSEMEK